MKSLPLVLVSLAAAFSLAGCGGGDGLGDNASVHFDFNADADRWQSGFADYPAGSEAFYELSGAPAALPESLGASRSGYRLSGNNHSDDLFMFVKRRVTGLRPDTSYRVRFELAIGSNAKSGCSGVGGSPGEGVTLKAGATAVEPSASKVDAGSGNLAMNIDKGQQTSGGQDALVLGDASNGVDCASADTSYRAKSLDSGSTTLLAKTDSQGGLWILFGSDSGYEATTTLYLTDARLSFERAD